MLPIIILSGLLPSVLAQYNNPAASSGSSTATVAATSTATASSSIQTITVGKNGLVFEPSSVVVAAGHSVVFQFYPGHHSVVQGDFSKPCQPANASAFFSGFIDSSSGPASNVFTLPINNTDPIFFYCSSASHCQSGMVGVINPGTAQTLNDYSSAAAKASGSSSPSVVQGGVVGAAASSSGTTSSSAGASSSTAKSAGGKVESSTFGFVSSVLAFVLLAQI